MVGLGLGPETANSRIGNSKSQIAEAECGGGGARAASAFVALGRDKSAKGAVTGRQIDLPRNPESFRGVTVPP